METHPVIVITEQAEIKYHPAWPKEPPVQSSIYRDELAIRSYRKAIENAQANALPVKNKEHVLKLLWDLKLINEDMAHDAGTHYVPGIYPVDYLHYVINESYGKK